EPDQRLRLLEQYCSKEVARILRLPWSKLNVYQPLTSLGFDSLMAIELKNRLEVDLGLVIPMVNILQDPNIVQLSTLLLERWAAMETNMTIETFPLNDKGVLHIEGTSYVTPVVSVDNWEEGEL